MAGDVDQLTQEVTQLRARLVRQRKWQDFQAGEIQRLHAVVRGKQQKIRLLEQRVDLWKRRCFMWRERAGGRTRKTTV